MQKSIDVVVIGGGYFANFQINAWLRLTGVNLVAIVEPDTSKHDALKEKISLYSSNHTLITRTLTSAVHDNKITIVDIATPPSSHAALITQAVALECPYICLLYTSDAADE